eukprot:6014191-Prymnesium_polylepis.2
MTWVCIYRCGRDVERDGRRKRHGRVGSLVEALARAGQRVIAARAMEVREKELIGIWRCVHLFSEGWNLFSASPYLFRESILTKLSKRALFITLLQLLQLSHSPNSTPAPPAL